MFHDPRFPYRTAPDVPHTRTRITVMQGMVETAGDEDIVLTTVLGSCVAVCLFDPIARIGGMNHFLLAEPAVTRVNADVHYGVYLMELLVNEMLKQGAIKSRMKAHVYGGANIHANLRPIGDNNSALAERFLKIERIRVSHRDVGGDGARRVDFLAASGKARCRHIDNAAVEAVKSLPIRSVGDVEYF